MRSKDHRQRDIHSASVCSRVSCRRAFPWETLGRGPYLLATEIKGRDELRRSLMLLDRLAACKRVSVFVRSYIRSSWAKHEIEKVNKVRGVKNKRDNVTVTRDYYSGINVIVTSNRPWQYFVSLSRILGVTQNKIKMKSGSNRWRDSNIIAIIQLTYLSDSVDQNLKVFEKKTHSL